MSLVTNSHTGIGMVACYESAIAGRGVVVGVGQRDYLVPGEQEAQFLDRIHDAAKFFRIKCDISDAAAWSDTLAFANNINAHDEYSPVLARKAMEAQLKAMDSLDVVEVLLGSLHRMLAEKEPIDSLQLKRAREFKSSMAGGLHEARMRARTEPCDERTRDRLAQFQDSLMELSRLVELFQKLGLVKEHDEGLARPGTLGGLLPAEAAGAAEQPEPPPSRDALLELIERELPRWSSAPAAACGPAGGLARGPEMEREVVPGSRPGPFPAPGAPTPGCATPSRDTAVVAEESCREVPLPPPPPRRCEACGQQCAASGMHCPECQREAERSSLTEAISRAKEEARLRAEQDAARRVRREEAECRAEEDAARRAEEDAERKAKEAEEKAKADALKAAKADAKAKGVKKAPEEYICLRSHALQKFVAPAGLQCQVCAQTSVEGASMWGCRFKDARGVRTCYYDVCSKCRSARSRRKLRELGELV